MVQRSKRHEPYKVTGPADIYRFMAGLGNESAEHAYEILLDGQKRIAGVYLAGKGSVSSCLVDMAEVFKAALVTNSPAFALVHNHPSGVTVPSAEDKSLAGRIQEGPFCQDE